jgi:hypothetical protein
MNKLRAYLLITIVVSLLLAGCNLPTNSKEETPAGSEAVQTAAALTVAAYATQVAGTPVATLPQVVVATATPQPTSPPPTQAPTLPPVPTTKPTEAVPCDRGDFVTDVTIPDDTVLKPGEKFTKTWRIKNTGSCTWTTSYDIVFVDGNAMNAPASIKLPKSVAPGETVDISVEMTAPTEPKTYKSNWKLRNASSAVFGLGSKADGVFFVQIVVKSAGFAVTSATAKVDSAKFEGACPHTFKLSADITASSSGTVTYFWEFSDGSKSGVSSLKYDSAGTKAVSIDKEFSASGTYNGKIYIDAPNHQYFPAASFELVCN